MTYLPIGLVDRLQQIRYILGTSAFIGLVLSKRRHGHFLAATKWAKLQQASTNTAQPALTGRVTKPPEFHCTLAPSAALGLARARSTSAARFSTAQTPSRNPGLRNSRQEDQEFRTPHRISVCGVMWMMPFATTFLPLYSGSLQAAARKCSARYRRKEKE